MEHLDDKSQSEPPSDATSDATGNVIGDVTGDVTVVLGAINRGEQGAAEKLLPLVYEELRRIAGEKMAHEGRAVTLQATMLVHEAWLRLAGPDASPQSWHGRAHFFSAAAEAMRRILVDQARRRLSQKRGGRAEHVSLENVEVPHAPDDEKLLQVHEVLDNLAMESAQMAQIVKLRFFAGFTHEEIATMLEVNEKTVRRQWTQAKDWLFKAIKAAGLSGLRPGE